MPSHIRNTSVHSSPGNTAMRRRFWAEVVCGTCTGLLAVVTLFWRDWIEAVFGVDPDHGNGGFEWFVVAGLAVVTIVLAMVARMEWRLAVRRVTPREA